MASVYIETSVVSYLTSKPSRDLVVAGHQQITREWWESVLPKVEPYVSLAVLEEIAKGDVKEAKHRLQVVEGFSVLRPGTEVAQLAEAYFQALGLPSRAKADSVHLALAGWHGMEYLVTWNCVHIASGRVRSIVAGINEGRGIRTPTICTPEELMEV